MWQKCAHSLSLHQLNIIMQSTDEFHAGKLPCPHQDYVAPNHQIVWYKDLARHYHLAHGSTEYQEMIARSLASKYYGHAMQAKVSFTHSRVK